MSSNPRRELFPDVRKKDGEEKKAKESKTSSSSSIFPLPGSNFHDCTPPTRPPASVMTPFVGCGTCMLYSKRKATTEKKEREKKQDPTPKPLSGKKRNREEETTPSSSSSDPKVEERKKKRRIKNFALVGEFDASGITSFLEKTNKLQEAIMTFPTSASGDDLPDELRKSLMESRQELATQVEFLNHQFITITTKAMRKLMDATSQDIADTVAAEVSDSD